MACPFFGGILPVLFSLFSMIFVEQVNGRVFFSFSVLRVRELIYLALSLCSFILALFTYPSTAMFILVPTLVFVLFGEISEWKETRLRVLRNLTVFFVGSLIYFIIHRFILLPFVYPNLTDLELGNHAGDYAFSITAGFYGRARWFIKDLSRVSFNLWNIYPKVSVAIGVFLFILTSFAIAIYRIFSVTNDNRRTIAKHIIQIVVTVVALLVLSNLPNLISSGGKVLAYRTIFPYSAMIALLIMRSIVSLVDILPEGWEGRTANVIVGVIMMGAGFSAQYNLFTTAFNDNIELSFIRNTISQHLRHAQEKPTTFVVSLIEGGHNFLNLPVSEAEFNASATHPIQYGPLQGLLRLALSQLNYYPERYKIIILNPNRVALKLVDFYTLKNRTVFINMNDIFGRKRNRKRNIVEVNNNSFMVSTDSANDVNLDGVIDVNNELGRHGVEFGEGKNSKGVIDESPRTPFWETRSPFPHWIRYDFWENPLPITKYALQAGFLTDRMPRDWEFQGSDGVRWRTLDIRKNEISWKKDEKRTYYFINFTPYRYYRLYITAGTDKILRIYKMEPSAMIDNFPEEMKSQHIIIPIDFYTNGVYDETFSAINAFDGRKGNMSRWHSPKPAGTLGWLACKLRNPRKLKGISVTRSDDTAAGLVQAPRVIDIEGSNDNQNWKHITTISGLQWEKGGETKHIKVDNAIAYRYYKFDFTKNRSYTEWISLVDIILYDRYEFKSQENLIPIDFYTNGVYNETFSAEKAFDGRKGNMSRWHSPKPAGTLGWLACKLRNPRRLKRMSVTISDDDAAGLVQAPRVIDIEGSNDNQNWKHITTISGLQWEKGGETKHIRVDNAIAYQYYKFDFTKNRSYTEWISLADIELFDH